MKAIEIRNVTLVVNFSLIYMDWRDTSIKFMMDIKIANENLVANHFPKPIICEGTHDKSCEFLQVYLWISNQFWQIYLYFPKMYLSGLANILV